MTNFSHFSEELRVVLDAAGPSEGSGEDEWGPRKVNSAQERPGLVAEPVWVWGVPFAPLTMAQTVATIDVLIGAGQPSYFITANVHYAMLTELNPDLRRINERAAFIVADGAPLVWASRCQKTPLPERVAGSDLIFELSALAARKGYRLFLMGGAPGVADQAALRLRERYPELLIAGVECPPFRQPTPAEEAALVERIRAARADILLGAFSQPKGERWMDRYFQQLAVPVCVQLGAAIDFAAGRVSRAPRWMQKCGMEWAFRLWLEPRRLFGRYARNAWFIARMVVRDLFKSVSRTGRH